MKLMDEISYGVSDKNNKNLLEIYDEDEVFSQYYYLQTPEELKKQIRNMLESSRISKENILKIKKLMSKLILYVHMMKKYKKTY